MVLITYVPSSTSFLQVCTSFFKTFAHEARTCIKIGTGPSWCFVTSTFKCGVHLKHPILLLYMGEEELKELHWIFLKLHDLLCFRWFCFLKTLQTTISTLNIGSLAKTMWLETIILSETRIFLAWIVLVFVNIASKGLIDNATSSDSFASLHHLPTWRHEQFVNLKKVSQSFFHIQQRCIH